MSRPAQRRESAGRTARASVEVFTLTVLTHSVTGGGLPSLPWLVGVAGLVALSTGWVLRGSVRLAVMLPVLVVGQLAMHALLASLSTRGHGHAGHLSGSPSWADQLTPRMLVAHLLCAALTAVVWWVRRSVCEVVLALGRQFALRTWPSRIAALGTSLGAVQVWLLGAPGRAPPSLLAPA